MFSCKPLARKLQTAACLASPLRASGLPPGAGVVSYQAAVGTIFRGPVNALRLGIGTL